VQIFNAQFENSLVYHTNPPKKLKREKQKNNNKLMIKSRNGPKNL